MINLTPHPITLRADDGAETTIQPSGTVARVTMHEFAAGEMLGLPVIQRDAGDVTGLPTDGTPCIVSSMVLAALPAGTPGVYAPDTGPTAIRDERGQIVAVTRLVAA